MTNIDSSLSITDCLALELLAWGANCIGCCSGFCGADGVCGLGGCRAVGCDCITGTLNPCDEGLACCPTFEGTLGGPGICAPRGICG